ncbi:cache domain-containing sensor histidine kinase [Paenibacillus sp. MMS18-CY102]|uniref:cache domain-containing sensor histidine kinase n=1 Tax=Paenibacillus sp. MMS18-CY102 TaxID=2682849 RepID=UPI0013660DE1|nr:sensor histidine kinase [Paenibacillus sp. MMS18-CY102]
MGMRARLNQTLQRVRFRMEQMSLQRRLFAAYILILFIPGIIVSVYMFNQLADNDLQDEEIKLRGALNIEAINVQNNIETMERAAQLSISDKDVLYYLQRTGEANASELIELKDNAISNIIRLQFNNPNLAHIRLYSDGQNVTELWPVILKEHRVWKEKWYDRVNQMNGKELWSFERTDKEPLQWTESTGVVSEPKIALLREIEYPTGKHVGIMEIDMLMQNFFPNVFNNQDPGQSRMVVLDNEGQLFHGKDSLPKEMAVGELQSQLAQRLPAGGLAPELDKDNVESASIRFAVNGRDYLAAYQYVEKIDGYLVNLSPLEAIFKDVKRTRNQIIAAFIILFAAVSVATYFLNGIILKKLHQLTESMKRVRQGDFHIDLTIRGGGEVGELAHHFRKMVKKINELIADAVMKQAATQEAELRTLKNQIDSHFLYNTLENIKMMAEIEDQRDISDALTSLGGLMRYSLRWTSDYVSLREEINHINNYIAIMNIRYEERMGLTTDIDSVWLRHEVLKMSLQPIVENSIKHGSQFPRGAMRQLVIAITVVALEDSLEIVVEDNGIGMREEQLEGLNWKLSGSMNGMRAANGSDGLEHGKGGGKQPVGPVVTAAGSLAAGVATGDAGGIGLLNVQQRIWLHYGKGYGLRVESEEGAFTRVVMTIPLSERNA